eukprot:TRINITY_DN9582_c0_g9_i1.p1 TRINITY_DN9582_c0_g9~~TRINITY_DN9582_c0_g9_i1.p1  ORF type:complete len:239 (+),score=18.71 TRINITY_DN9582_c0_g9_i1:107-823(+)
MDFDSMNAAQLKEYIAERGLQFNDCLERTELIARANQAADRACFECAVCLETESERATMPCCDTTGSSISFCRRCVEIICKQGLGRCPCCRAYIRIADGVVSVSDNEGPCVLCRQNKILVDANMCDACVLGSRFALNYECQRCSRVQRIPHPMWRYQAHPSEFGDTSWACHQQCGDYTHWRVVPDHVSHIPLQDAPEGWGTRDQWLASVGEQSRAERDRAGHAPDPSATRGAGSCTTM